jgi:hypothetical protein
VIKLALTCSAHTLQAAFDLVLAELSKIIYAVTVAQSCQPLPCSIHSAEPHTAGKVNTKIYMARPGQAESQVEAVASLDPAAGGSLGAGTQGGLSAVDSVVEVEVKMAQEAAGSVKMTVSDEPSQDPVSMAREKQLADHEDSGQNSDITISSLSPSAGTAHYARAKLPRLASRAPDLKFCTSDREVQLQNHNGSRPTSPERPQSRYEVDSDCISCTLR